MTTDLRPLLTVHVLGTPKPKGSMRHVGNGRMIEQLKDSPAWRAAVVNAAWRQYHDGMIRDPYTSAVKVTIVLELPRPAKPKDPHFPSSANTGDVDKHARNILDALQDAGVVKNDAQVIDLTISKRYTTFTAGAHITVWPANAVNPDPLPCGAEPGSPPQGRAGNTLPTEADTRDQRKAR